MYTILYIPYVPNYSCAEVMTTVADDTNHSKEIILKNSEYFNYAIDAPQYVNMRQ